MNDTIDHHGAIRHFARNASLEITPGVRNKIDSFADVMNPGRRVFITHLPGKSPEPVIKTAIQLRNDGMEPVPHLGARSFRDVEQLDDVLHRLREEADVRDLLLIGGDVPKPVGEFTSTIDMLQTDLFQKYGLRSVGVSGHPEGNPNIPGDEIRLALQYKNEYAKHHNIHMYIVSQFSFDDKYVLRWLDDLETWGNHLPVNIGLPGPAKLKTLINYARFCGVKCSTRFLRKQGLKLFRMASMSYPAELITALATHCAQHDDSLITRAHLYNFGGLQRTVKFIRALENGDFEMIHGNSSFRLTTEI